MFFLFRWIKGGCQKLEKIELESVLSEFFVQLLLEKLSDDLKDTENLVLRSSNAQNSRPK